VIITRIPQHGREKDGAMSAIIDQPAPVAMCSLAVSSAEVRAPIQLRTLLEE
jgi:hypothetical protein